MSGAGKRHALRFFEDAGHYCVDNLPAALVPAFADLSANGRAPRDRVALFVDARGGDDLAQLPGYLKTLEASGLRAQVLFLETSDEVLHRRYSESRRRHPMSPNGSIEEGIRIERELLAPIRERADLLLDTSSISESDLRERIAEVFAGNKQSAALTISVMSFGFKYGLPHEADLVFDLRFLPNPYYDAEFRHIPGTEPEVREYVLNNEAARAFLEHVKGLLKFLIPQYRAEPKSYLTIAVGCTGGRHRSVAVAPEIVRLLRDLKYDARLRHRDIDREADF